MDQVLAPLGKEFTLTEFGFEQPRIRAKYELGSLDRDTYKIEVPKSWVENGFVKLIEVKDEISK